MTECGVMPKEKINYAPEYVSGSIEHPDGAVVGEISNIAWNPVEGAEDPGAWVPGSTLVGKDAQVAVGWHRDSWVQVSIEADPGYFRMAADTVDGDDGRTSVYTPPLSRDEVNKLIRVLRRARDQVFGRDE